MIKRLRMKFVAINMAIVMVMLCVILGLVFTFTRANLEAESISMMKTIAAAPFRPVAPEKPDEDVRLPYFVVHLGIHGEILEADGGYYDLSDDGFLKTLIRKTLESPRTLGVLEEYNLRYYRLDTPADRCLVFADISSERATLEHLMLSCVAIGVLGFLLFFAISIGLSRWSVRPVENAWEQQRQFVADASHELKTPLTVIMTSADLAADELCETQEKKKLLGNIQTMAEQMKGLIEQLLELARADREEVKGWKAQPEVLNLSEVVEETGMTFEPVFFEKGLSFLCEVEPGVHVRGRREDLVRLTEILLDNAAKYSRPGGRTKVTLTRGHRKHCVLCVSNEGEPIAGAELHHIFRRFYRADSARSRNGSYGLGLSIAQNIAHGHGGTIRAESADGQNRFFVELSCEK